MYSLEKEQKVYDLNGTKIGGQPGEYPTVMIGSIFYEGQGLVEDSEKGKFDEEKARQRISKAEELSQETGNPIILDVVGDSSEALINYIDFVAEETDVPFLIDGTTADIRIPATEHVGEVGLEDRAIYNTISPEYKEEELEAIQDAGLDSAMLLCFNTTKPTIDGRLESFEETIELAEEAGIEKPLVDPGILDLPDPGVGARTIHEIKKEYGVPSGCAAHNAVDQWNERKEMESTLYTLRTAVANALPIAWGADFTLFGPIEDAEDMFAACSLVDAYVSYAMQLGEQKGPATKEHPIKKIFRT